MSDRAAVTPIVRIAGAASRTDQDLVAVEAPLTIVVRQAVSSRSLGVLLRTPGDDDELAIGLLHGEGVITTPDAVLAIEHTRSDDAGEVIALELAAGIDLDALVGRALPATSACGLCGRLEMRALAAAAGPAGPAIAADVIAGLPQALRQQQSVFAETGGLHAAGLFDRDGRALVIREDVGRHNAVDKVIGWAFRSRRLPARDLILAVSGRVAFEIVQKAAMAGVPLIAAVGAPSSLAVEAARAANLTLVGFVRDGRLNIYTGRDRIAV